MHYRKLTLCIQGVSGMRKLTDSMEITVTNEILDDEFSRHGEVYTEGALHENLIAHAMMLYSEDDFSWVDIFVKEDDSNIWTQYTVDVTVFEAEFAVMSNVKVVTPSPLPSGGIKKEW